MDADAVAGKLRASIRDRTAEIGVIGLGYVGLPLAVTFAEADFRVTGFDTDAAKVESLQGGDSYIASVDAARVSNLRNRENFHPTADLTRLGEPDALIICVPTPLGEDRQPDLRYVLDTVRAIAQTLRSGQLIVLESTTYPGTTREVVLPVLEENGPEEGRFFLAYSPEREDPGNRVFSVASIPKVVGGIDPVSTALAAELYGSIVPEVVTASGPDVAEATKLTENVFRAVNIALVNELKVVYSHLGIDIWEVLDCAATKPFGFMRFNPGPGWGGHCIPIDPFYLGWKARQAGADARFIELAGEINVEMPRWVANRLDEALRTRGKTLRGSRVLLLGLAYKKDVSDPRESPAFELLSILESRGAEVGYHDPYIAEAPAMRSWSHLPPLQSLPLAPEMLARQDAVVVVTDHSDVDYDMILEHSALVVDTRGVYRQPSDRIVKA